MPERVYRNDTATIDASLFDEDGVNLLPATTINWIVKRPDGTEDMGGPTAVESADATVIYNNTDVPGPYTAQVTFNVAGARKSVIVPFEVVDPLETTTDSTNPVDQTVDRAWMKLEDLFDSELGGPHLRDRTLQSFDREKMKRLLPDALYGINNTYQPATGYDDITFPFDQHLPLLAQALLVEGVGHLMRSYVEQPLPTGGQLSYFDRRDYMNRWQQILTAEQTKLIGWIDLFKRDLMGFGNTSVLVGGYASYPTRYPRYMRGRYPYVYRG